MLEVIDKYNKFLMLVLKVPAPSHHTEDASAFLSSHSHSCSYSRAVFSWVECFGHLGGRSARYCV